MRARSYWLSLLCVLLVAASFLLVWPVAETGLLDDWSYAFTANDLARTGHVHYNGWSTALLGWPLYVAAGAIRVFGFSFTVVRLTVMAEALLCVWLLHRTLLRAGLSAWNALAGTLLVAFSPVFLPYAVTFMSDIPGLLGIVLCLYGCLRALQEENDRASQLWLGTAAFGNVLLGSARQIAWLGVLVMVPSALWVLHRRRRILVDTLVTGAAVALVFLILHWYTTQPYAVPEKVLPSGVALGALGHLFQVAVAFGLDLGLLLVPVALGLWALPGRLTGWRRAVCFAAGALGLVFATRVLLQHHGSRYMVPALRFSKITQPDLETLFSAAPAPPKGPAPRPLLPVLQGIGSFVAGGALFCLLAAALLPGRKREELTGEEVVLAWADLLWLTLPFLLAYCLLLTPRALSTWLFDRYLLLLLPPVVLLASRLYQRHVATRPSAFVWIALAIMAAFSIVSNHDTFALTRASLAATRAVEASGIPRTAIDGGWEYNHYTELLVSGFVWQDGMRLPGGRIFHVTEPYPPIPPCSLEAQPQTPHVHPRYSLAFPGASCQPVETFAPVHYRTWMPPFRRTLFVTYADQ